jgi:hypothetical protein
MKEIMSKEIWVTWEDHRRSRELARALGISIIVQESSLPKGVSHIHRSIKFLTLIVAVKPSVVFVQNPSRILAFVASLLRFRFKYKLVVDRHTNFRLGKKNGLNPVNYFNDFVGNYSLRKADLTIVTNSYLKKIVEEREGKAFVLEDLLPTFDALSPQQQVLLGRINVVFICTYANDEPYREVIKAASLLPKDVHIYITGKIPDKFETKNLPANITLTGFLSENKYSNLLYSVELIIDFTTLEWCLVCGGYEAASLGKPLLTSKTVALESLFGQAAAYTTHSPVDIADSIRHALNELTVMEEKMIKFRSIFRKKSEKKLQVLRDSIKKMSS